MTPEEAAKLRAPFPAASIGSLPRGGTKLDYVGHAAVTDRLLAVDPEWNWEPVAWAADGTPYWQANGNDAILWIRLTVAGTTRLGVGICKSDAFELEKQLIGDALRNAAMRFGVALDLWSKEDLASGVESRPESGRAPAAGGGEAVDPAPQTSPPISKAKLASLAAKARSLTADGVKVADERARRGLPLLDNCTAAQLADYALMLGELEAELTKPFDKASA